MLRLNNLKSGFEWLQRRHQISILVWKTPFRNYPNLTAGLVLVGLLLILLCFGPLLSAHSPTQINAAERLTPPSELHWMGTDSFGRDLFSRIVFGAYTTLGMGLLALHVAVIPGLLMGLLAGYFDGWVDVLFSRLVDVWLSLPGLMLAIILIARMGPSIFTTAFALGVTGIPSFFRLVRNETIALKQQEFVQAAVSLGASHMRIILRHLLPQQYATLIVMVTMRFGIFILAGSGLSFIGLGAQPPSPEWGVLLADGRNYFNIAWWLGVFPGLIVVCTVLGFNLLGDGLRDRLEV